MRALLQSFCERKAHFDDCIEYFAFHHPYLAFWAMFIGMPIFILIAVVLSTTLIAFPMAWFFGWM